MRRRQVYVPPEPSGHTALFIAAGAIAGAAAGLYLGRRYRTMDAFLEDMRDRLDDLRLAWNEERDDMDVLVAEDEVDDAAIEELAEQEWDDEEYDDIGAQLDDDLVDDEEEDDDELGDLAASNGSAHGADTSERARLEHRVLEALQGDRRLRSRAIEIAVVGDGVVELTGSVHALEEISRATSVARKVDGVAMVLNRIELRAAGSSESEGTPRASSEATGSETGATE